MPSKTVSLLFKGKDSYVVVVIMMVPDLTFEFRNCSSRNLLALPLLLVVVVVIIVVVVAALLYVMFPAFEHVVPGPNYGP